MKTAVFCGGKRRKSRWCHQDYLGLGFKLPTSNRRSTLQTVVLGVKVRLSQPLLKQFRPFFLCLWTVDNQAGVFMSSGPFSVTAISHTLIDFLQIWHKCSLWLEDEVIKIRWFEFSWVMRMSLSGRPASISLYSQRRTVKTTNFTLD